ncbi:hypothetical protein ANCDUO_24955 [Ancylostoma duodenale]|uniref:Leucine Rich repeat-containing domain protein n=1 Tax=Ancylostoma duodenale TaxID=51022 RepID=A0A0C2F962_9BILA|nr:hypothetical protein ANCDUO_24955 [Ancylostoma duodenale]
MCSDECCDSVLGSYPGCSAYADIQLKIIKVYVQGVSSLSTLREIYLAQNGVQSTSGLENLSNLEILDFNYNRLNKVHGIRHLKKLTDFWAKNNKLSPDGCLQRHEQYQYSTASGLKVQYIVKVLSLHRIPLQDIAKSFRKLGNSENKEGGHFSTAAATPKEVNVGRSRIDKNP